jgi:hypothetical protein
LPLFLLIYFREDNGKKMKFQHNEDILMNQLKKLDIKKEIKKLKRSLDSDSDTSDSDSD